MRIVGGPTISSPSIRRPQRSNFGLIVRVPERHQSPWRKSELGICPEDRALLVAKKQEMIGRYVFLKPPPDLTPFSLVVSVHSCQIEFVDLRVTNGGLVGLARIKQRHRNHGR